MSPEGGGNPPEWQRYTRVTREVVIRGGRKVQVSSYRRNLPPATIQREQVAPSLEAAFNWVLDDPEVTFGQKAALIQELKDYGAEQGLSAEEVNVAYTKAWQNNEPPEDIYSPDA